MLPSNAVRAYVRDERTMSKNRDQKKGGDSSQNKLYRIRKGWRWELSECSGEMAELLHGPLYDYVIGLKLSVLRHRPSHAKAQPHSLRNISNQTISIAVSRRPAHNSIPTSYRHGRPSISFAVTDTCALCTPLFCRVKQPLTTLEPS